MLLDLVAILLERVECVLDGLVDGLLDGVADLGDLVDAPHVPGGVGDADGRHVEAGPVEPGPLAQLLDNLHHDPLPVALISHLAEKMPGALFSFFSIGFMVQALFVHNCEISRRKKLNYKTINPRPFGAKIYRSSENVWEHLPHLPWTNRT